MAGSKSSEQISQGYDEKTLPRQRAQGSRRSSMPDESPNLVDLLPPGTDLNQLPNLTEVNRMISQHPYLTEQPYSDATCEWFLNGGWTRLTLDDTMVTTSERLWRERIAVKFGGPEFSPLQVVLYNSDRESYVVQSANGLIVLFTSKVAFPIDLGTTWEIARGRYTLAFGQSTGNVEVGSLFTAQNVTPHLSGKETQRKHRCPYCSIEFNRHHNLKSHLLTHASEKPYVCATCQSRFRRLHDLKRHTKLHTGERPATCPKCDRKFAREDALARHTKGPGGCAGRRMSMGDFDGGNNTDQECKTFTNHPPLTSVMEEKKSEQGENILRPYETLYQLPPIRTFPDRPQPESLERVSDLSDALPSASLPRAYQTTPYFPKDHNLAQLDALIAASTAETEKLMEQRNLLRDRQARLDSRDSAYAVPVILSDMEASIAKSGTVSQNPGSFKTSTTALQQTGDIHQVASSSSNQLGDEYNLLDDFLNKAMDSPVRKPYPPPSSRNLTSQISQGSHSEPFSTDDIAHKRLNIQSRFRRGIVSDYWHRPLDPPVTTPQQAAIEPVTTQSQSLPSPVYDNSNIIDQARVQIPEKRTLQTPIDLPSFPRPQSSTQSPSRPAFQVPEHPASLPRQHHTASNGENILNPLFPIANKGQDLVQESEHVAGSQNESPSAHYQSRFIKAEPSSPGCQKDVPFEMPDKTGTEVQIPIETRAPTDSGYASINHLIQNLPTAEVAKDLRQVVRSEAECDSMTIYSTDASVETTRRDDFVQRFADTLHDNVTGFLAGYDNLDPSIDKLDHLLADFAVRLGQENSALKIRQALQFIHRYRRSIDAAFRHTMADEMEDDASDEQRSQDKMPVAELMRMWYDRREDIDMQTDPENGHTEQRDCDIDADEDAPDMVGQQDFESYQQLISSTTAYKWLVSSLLNRALLTPTDATTSQIRAEVFQHIPRQVQVSRTESVPLLDATFELEWGSIGSEGALASILTVTGSATDAQALPCIDYVRQTWPSTGESLIQLLTDAQRSSVEEIVINRPDGATLHANISESRAGLPPILRVAVRGVRNIISETAEQLCWLAAALISPSYTAEKEGFLLCSPRLHFTGKIKANHDPSDQGQESGSGGGTSREVYSFQILREYEEVDKSQGPGTCWHQLFHYCIIVNGYPIRRRASSALGLEMSLGLIASLLGTKYVQQFGEDFFFKHFSAILVPTLKKDGAVVWHLCRRRNHTHLSYLDHGIPHIPQLEYQEMLRMRHIVGWCSSVRYECGHRDSNYAVARTYLPLYTNGVLSSCRLYFGRPAGDGGGVAHSPNCVPASLSHRNYLDMFRYLQRRVVLFWDTGSNRGWLLNGLISILHLLRQSLHIDKDEAGEGLFIFNEDDLTEPACSHTARAAWHFFNNQQNLSARLSISSIQGNETKYETFGERFERFYDVIEKAFDYQRRCKTWAQIPRSHLEGWDFLSLARKEDPIEPSLFRLPPIGWGWTDFVRACGAITFMGNGFGDMLGSSDHQCLPMPMNHFGIAVTVTDMQIILNASRCNPSASPRIICRSPSIVWYSPQGSNTFCEGGAHETNQTSRQHVQVMWPTEHSNLLPPGSELLDLAKYPDGAVIFAHTNELEYHLPDLGFIPSAEPMTEYTKEADTFEDSGIGSSQESDMNLDRVRSATSNNFMEQTQSHTDLSISQSYQGHSFRDSTVNGGCPVYGNVSNLSVIQYFGHQISQTNLKQENRQPPQTKCRQFLSPFLPASRSHSSVGGGDESVNLSLSDVSGTEMNNVEAGDRNIELQQADLEIRAMGLQAYCSVLEL